MAWKYEIDPAYDPRGQVPPWAIIAAAPCDGDGNIVGPWQTNPNCRPSVLATLLKRLPSDGFLLAFGEYLRGEIGRDDFRSRFSETAFYVLANEAQDALLVIDDGAGPAYSLYTSMDLLGGEVPPKVRHMHGSQILPLARGCEGLIVNQSENGSLWLPTADIVDHA